MSRYGFAFFVLALVSAVLLSYDLVAANTSMDFGGGNLKLLADKTQGYLLGPVRYFVAIVTGGYGFLNSLITQSLKPLMIFGAISLASSVMPSFIEGVYGMLIQ